MKKILALLLALALVLSLAACAAEKDDDRADGDKTSGSEQAAGTQPEKPDESDEPDEPGEPDTAEPDEPDEPDGKEYGAVDGPDPFGPEVLELIASAGKDTAQDTGSCGKDLTWYRLDNVLVIRGKGDMEDYNFSANDAPWFGLAGQIDLVYVEDGVTSVGQFAFEEMTELQGVYMANSVTSIRSGAFLQCESLTYVRCSGKLTEIGELAFQQSGVQTFSFPRGIAKIGRNTFWKSDLTSVELPEGLTEIGNGAFSDTKLTSVTVPEGVTTIESQAFGFLTHLESITIPASVTHMGPALANGHATTVIFAGDAPEMEERNGLLLGLKEGSTIQYAGEGFEEYVENYPEYNWVKQ